MDFDKAPFLLKKAFGEKLKCKIIKQKHVKAGKRW